MRLGVVQEWPDAFAAITDDVLANVHDRAHALGVERHPQKRTAGGEPRFAHDAATGGSTRLRPGMRLSCLS